MLLGGERGGRLPQIGSERKASLKGVLAMRDKDEENGEIARTCRCRIFLVPGRQRFGWYLRRGPCLTCLLLQLVHPLLHTRADGRARKQQPFEYLLVFVDGCKLPWYW